MADLEKMLKDVLLGGVGAVATVVEKGGEVAQKLVEKGRETVRDNREATEELKRRFKEACPCGREEPDIDVSGLSPEQRESLRRQLDLMDEEDRTQTHDTQDETNADNG